MAEKLTVEEENKSVSPEELAEKFGKEVPSPEGGATPEGDVPTEPIGLDYEVPYPDGSKEQITADVMSERLINYRGLQSKVGKQADEIGEYKRKIAEHEKSQVPVTPKPEGSPKEFGSLTDEDMEDPTIVRKAFGEVMKQNANLSKQVEDLPGIIEKKAEEQESVREMRRVMSSHPKMKKIKDEVLKEQIVRGASAWGFAMNQSAGRSVYGDMDTAVDGFMTLMQGGEEPTTQQAFVRNLKGPQNDVLPASGGKPIGDVVKRYEQLTTPDERANFLKTLNDEEIALIDAEVYKT